MGPGLTILGILGGARAVGAILFVSTALLGLVTTSGCGDGSDYDSGAEVRGYDVEFSGLGDLRVGALQLEIEYLGRRGGFLGRGDAVECVSLVEALVASNYLGERVVKIGLISLHGIRLPAPVMRCGFQTSEELSPASFLVVVTDASDTTSVQLDPPPEVVVSAVTPR